MRVPRLVVTSLFLAPVVVLGAVAAQAPSSKKAMPARMTSAGKPVGTLAQVMRGILFPNANIIFDVQQTDPGAPPKKRPRVGDDASTSETFSNVYTGWEVVQNAAVALAQSADLIMMPGRFCQNGKPVPVGRADFQKYAQGLREAGIAALKVAETKDREKMEDATNAIADACSNCHEPYRDKGDATSLARCTPPTAAEMDRIKRGAP
jgi:cytochrome c556